MPREDTCTATHPVNKLTLDDDDNGIYFVISKTAANLHFFHKYKQTLMKAFHENYECSSQLIIRRHSPGFCSISLETYPDDVCNEVFNEMIDDSTTIGIYNTMMNINCDYVFQGSCFD